MKSMALNYNGEASLVELATPTIQPTQVLVKVQYSAIDTAIESVLSKTWTGTFVHKKTNPLVLGWHYAGTVVQVGGKVTKLEKNDKVWGFLQYDPSTNQGAFAEYIAVSPDECALQPKCAQPMVLAAASTEATTAYQALTKMGNLEKGQSVLILGAGGAVGSAAVQIAKNVGVHVTAVCSTKDVSRVRVLGADVVLDRQKVNNVLQTTDSYDIIFDTPSKYNVGECLSKLKPCGTYVVTIPSWGLLGGMIATLFSRKSAKFIGCHSTDEDLVTLGDWIVKDELKVDIDSTFDVKDLTKAREYHRNKKTYGRVVVKVEGGW